MTNPNEPAYSRAAFYDPDRYGYVSAQEGLTIREYFAANNYTDQISYDFAKAIMGKEPPPMNTIEYYQYWVEANGKHCVLKADAIIKALNEIKPTENEKKK